MNDLETILLVPAILSGVGVSAAIVVDLVRGYKLNKRSDEQHKAVLNSMNNSYETLNSLNSLIKSKHK